MAFTEDFSEFFDEDDFGVEFVYKPKLGPSVTVIGIYDNAFYETQGGEVGVAGSEPRIMYEAARINPSPAYGERVSIGLAEYTIVGIEPDGTGVNTLILEARDGTC